MRRKLLGALVLTMLVANSLVLTEVASGDDFTIMWVIELPRTTYFLGESVTFTVTAFASTDPTLKLPAQMAKITVRNQSMVEVFSTWVTTNANGSSPVVWTSQLTDALGNYTIILEDLAGFKTHETFDLLWNEETYWQTRVDMLEDEINRQYEYINYLFVFNKYLERLEKANQRRINTLWAIDFVILLVALWVFFPQLAQRAGSGKGFTSALYGSLGAIGLSNRSSILLDFEEVAQCTVPENKQAPRFNTENYCPHCDKKKEHPMILVDFEDHLMRHDRRRLRMNSIYAWMRERKRKAMRESLKPEPAPKLEYGTPEQYEHDMAEDRLKVEVKAVGKDLRKTGAREFVGDPEYESIKVRFNALKELLSEGKISEQEAAVRARNLNLELQRFKKKKADPEKLEKPVGESPVKPVYKQTTTRRLKVETKLPDEKPTFAQPEPQKKVVPNVMIRKFRTPVATQRDALDELIARLNHEKVN